MALNIFFLYFYFLLAKDYFFLFSFFSYEKKENLKYDVHRSITQGI